MGISPSPLKRLISTLPRPANSVCEQLVAVRVVARVEHLRPLREAEEGRDGKIEVALLDEFRQLAIEEGDEQRGDVGAVDVGVGHDDDLAVAQVFFAVA